MKSQIHIYRWETLDGVGLYNIGTALTVGARSHNTPQGWIAILGSAAVTAIKNCPRTVEDMMMLHSSDKIRHGWSTLRIAKDMFKCIKRNKKAYIHRALSDRKENRVYLKCITLDKAGANLVKFPDGQVIFNKAAIVHKEIIGSFIDVYYS